MSQLPPPSPGVPPRGRAPGEGGRPGSGEGFHTSLGIRVELLDPMLGGCGCGAVATFSPRHAGAVTGSDSPSDPAAAEAPGGGPGADGAERAENASTDDQATNDQTADHLSVPTGAVLALVDATARAAAEAAVAVPGRRTTLAATATGVQFREAARGTVTARASVPCEGVITDRADDRGLFRFSVAVEVLDPAGTRVASGTVQWLAQIGDDPQDAPDPVDAPVASGG